MRKFHSCPWAAYSLLERYTPPADAKHSKRALTGTDSYQSKNLHQVYTVLHRSLSFTHRLGPMTYLLAHLNLKACHKQHQFT